MARVTLKIEAALSWTFTPTKRPVYFYDPTFALDLLLEVVEDSNGLSVFYLNNCISFFTIA